VLEDRIAVEVSRAHDATSDLAALLESHAAAPGDVALDLHLYLVGVDDETTVVGTESTLHVQRAGALLDLHLCHDRHIGAVSERSVHGAGHSVF
jgi:hypothetical protein